MSNYDVYVSSEFLEPGWLVSWAPFCRNSLVMTSWSMRSDNDVFSVDLRPSQVFPKVFYSPKNEQMSKVDKIVVQPLFFQGSFVIWVKYHMKFLEIIFVYDSRGHQWTWLFFLCEDLKQQCAHFCWDSKRHNAWYQRRPTEPFCTCL